MNLKDWLMIEKKYSRKSAGDVESRINRAKKILNVKEINHTTLIDLEKQISFVKLSCSVKSQIRIAIRLYLEYINKGEKND